MNELQQLTEVCVRLGANRPQAEIMAAQLLKRATQLAAERGIARETALANLMEVVIRGRAGEVPPNFASKASESPREK
jgi:hypothetical protein